MTYYRRRSLETWEEAAALAAGALVGVGATYLARIWLRRSPTDRRDADRDGPTEGQGPRPPVASRQTEEGAGPPR